MARQMQLFLRGIEDCRIYENDQQLVGYEYNYPDNPIFEPKYRLFKEGSARSIANMYMYCVEFIEKFKTDCDDEDMFEKYEKVDVYQ